jgi:hypothetical protein
MPSNKKPPKPAPQKEQKVEIVWMSCRARAGCEGKQQQVVWKHRQPGGGFNFRYRCTTCNGVWHLPT